jgi:hypothetical protein
MSVRLRCRLRSAATPTGPARASALSIADGRHPFTFSTVHPGASPSAESGVSVSALSSCPAAPRGRGGRPSLPGALPPARLPCSSRQLIRLYWRARSTSMRRFSSASAMLVDWRRRGGGARAAGARARRGERSGPLGADRASKGVRRGAVAAASSLRASHTGCCPPRRGCCAHPQLGHQPRLLVAVDQQAQQHEAQHRGQQDHHRQHGRAPRRHPAVSRRHEQRPLRVDAARGGDTGGGVCDHAPGQSGARSSAACSDASANAAALHQTGVAAAAAPTHLWISADTGATGAASVRAISSGGPAGWLAVSW